METKIYREPTLLQDDLDRKRLARDPNYLLKMMVRAAYPKLNRAERRKLEARFKRQMAHLEGDINACTV